MNKKAENIKAIKKQDCCGCTACVSICPVNAIQMNRDEQGFDYPVVDSKRCCECGLCLKACQNTIQYKYNILSCYAAKNCNEEVVLTSSSGGIVDAFCKSIISKKGVVYAASYNENFELIYKRADTYDMCKCFRRSKYVQADLKRIFLQIYEDLLEKKKVLFVGTSCYVSGLRSYLSLKKCDIKNLYLIDFICHGVPSPALFADYVAFVNEKKNLLDIVFRNKRKTDGEKLKVPWKYGKYSCSLVYNDGYREVDSLKSRVYLNLFTSNNCLRPQCYKCNFIGTKKAGDITVADYWGIEDAHPQFADQQGVSAVMVHTKQGQELMNDCEDIIKIDSSIEKISKKQGMLRSASLKGNRYNEFWQDYKKHEFKYLAKKYGEYSLIGKIRQSKMYLLWVRIKYGE